MWRREAMVRSGRSSIAPKRAPPPTENGGSSPAFRFRTLRTARQSAHVGHLARERSTAGDAGRRVAIRTLSSAHLGLATRLPGGVRDAGEPRAAGARSHARCSLRLASSRALTRRPHAVRIREARKTGAAHGGRAAARATSGHTIVCLTYARLADRVGAALRGRHARLPQTRGYLTG